MKVIQMITRMDDMGGAQIHVRDICDALIENGHEVVVLAGGKGPIYKALTAKGIRCVDLKNLKRNIHPYYDIKAFFEIRKHVREINPDLIATHSAKAGIIGRLVAKFVNIPSIYTAHGWAFTEGVSKRKRWLYAKIEKWVSKRTKGIITVSNYDKNLALDHRVAQDNKMEVIHNGVREVEQTHLATPEIQPPTITMVARFASPKDQLTLLNALNNLRADNWKLMFVGDGPTRSTIEQTATEYGLNENVEFLGNRLDVANILASSQLFVLISKWEGLPLSVLEAMRGGLPIIASNVGGVKEAVFNGENGFLIERGNLEELIRKLHLLINTPILRKEMGEQSRKIYEQKFTVEKMQTKTINYYQKILDK
ncbi:glycosyltransferase family 4 protein [Bacillus timonensis]|nr:glycosyltransferase family 4 protein [Bacillus timonensis]